MDHSDEALPAGVPQRGHLEGPVIHATVPQVVKMEDIIKQALLLDEVAHEEDVLAETLARRMGQRAYDAIQSCRSTATVARQQAGFLRQALVTSAGGSGGS